jgi:hypothetical protein
MVKKHGQVALENMEDFKLVNGCIQQGLWCAERDVKKDVNNMLGLVNQDLQVSMSPQQKSAQTRWFKSLVSFIWSIPFVGPLYYIMLVVGVGFILKTGVMFSTSMLVTALSTTLSILHHIEKFTGTTRKGIRNTQNLLKAAIPTSVSDFLFKTGILEPPPPTRMERVKEYMGVTADAVLHVSLEANSTFWKFFVGALNGGLLDFVGRFIGSCAVVSATLTAVLYATAKATHLPIVGGIVNNFMQSLFDFLEGDLVVEDMVFD